MECEVLWVQFGILGSSMTMDMSACCVDQEKCTRDGRKSLSDPRMGASSKFVRCETCGGDSAGCQGHFGYMLLQKPVLNIVFLRVIINILNMFCHSCYGMKSELPQRVKLMRGRIERFKAAADLLTRVRKCRCGAASPRVKQGARAGSIVESVGLGWKELGAGRVLDLLAAISRESLGALDDLGVRKHFSDPRWMVMTALPVSPPCARPCHTYYESRVSSHFITKKYRDIMRIGRELERMECSDLQPIESIDSARQALAEKVWSIYDSEKYDRRGACAGGVKRALSGKHGRFRGNLAGKRVDYSARSVIVPDVNIRISEFGIPEELSEGFSRVVPVNRHNRHLPQCEGKADGALVEIPLRDGDWVVINRQPTLQRQNMLAARVRIHGGKCFRLNPFACGFFNADYDGDCMNVHGTNDENSRAEAVHLMSLEANIGCDKGFGLCSGMVQDGILSAHATSRPDCFLEDWEFFDAAASAFDRPQRCPQPAILKPKRLWTGKQLLSMAMPRDFYYQSGSGPCPVASPSMVVVSGGELLCGLLTASTVGRGERAIPHAIFLERGGKQAALFCEGMQRIAYHMCERRPHCLSPTDFSVDCSGLPDVRAEVRGERQGRYTGSGAMPRIRELEEECARGLERAASRSGLMAMVGCGSKGTVANLRSIVHSLGQQCENGGVIVQDDHGLTLPSYGEEWSAPESRGFVTSSFASGLSEREYFFASKTGRLCLVNKHVNTMASGYIQRKLSFGLQDLSVRHDASVRDGAGRIVQFIYGGDMLAPSSMLHVSEDPSETTFVDAEGLVREAFLRGVAAPREKAPGWAEEFADDLARAIHAGTLRSWGCMPVGGVESRSQWFALYVRDCLSRSTADGEGLREWMKARILAMHERAMVEPGEMVGLLAAQSISEPSTQLALDSPHEVGESAGVLSWSSRMHQIVSATKRTLNRVVSFSLGGKLGDFATLRVHSRSVEIEFDFRGLERFMDVPALLDFIRKGCCVENARALENDERVVVSISSREPARAALAVKQSLLCRIPGLLSTRSLVERTVESLARRLTVRACGVGEWEVCIEGCERCTEVLGAIRGGVKGVVARASVGCVCVRFAPSTVGGNAEELRRKLSGLRALGVRNARSARESSSSGRVVYSMFGPSVLDALAFPLADSATVRTTDLAEVSEVWGIEACRSCILSELEEKLCHVVARRHLCLLADKLTRDGVHSGFTASGLIGAGEGVLKSLCFEKPFDRLMWSCALGEVERFDDICSQMVFGKVPRIGAQSMDILVDLNALPDGAVEPRETSKVPQTPYLGDCGVEPETPYDFAPRSPRCDDWEIPSSPPEYDPCAKKLWSEVPEKEYDQCAGGEGVARPMKKAVYSPMLTDCGLLDGEHRAARALRLVAMKALAGGAVVGFDELVRVMASSAEGAIPKARIPAVARATIEQMRMEGRVGSCGIGRVVATQAFRK